MILRSYLLLSTDLSGSSSPPSRFLMKAPPYPVRRFPAKPPLSQRARLAKRAHSDKAEMILTKTVVASPIKQNNASQTVLIAYSAHSRSCGVATQPGIGVYSERRGPLKEDESLIMNMNPQ